MVDTVILEDALLAHLSELGPDASLDPAAVARVALGPHPDQWGPAMQPLRRIAVRLAEEGRAVILRKGKPIDPAEVKGLYRIGRARDD